MKRRHWLLCLSAAFLSVLASPPVGAQHAGSAATQPPTTPAVSP